MAEPLKTRGIAELTSLRRRTRRQRALGRISRIDYEYLEAKYNEIEARIISMKEHNKDGEEVGADGVE